MDIKYKPLSNEDSSSSEDHIDSWSRRQERSIKTFVISMFAASVVLFTVGVGLITTALLLRPSDQECASQVSSYSPLMDIVEYEDVNFVNNFMHQTVYRGPPTNRLEREWERLWNHDLIDVPEDKFPELNKSSDTRFMHTPHGGLAANIQVFHQLHCLNLIRQYTWLDYYEANADKVAKPRDYTWGNKDMDRIHVDHCIESLRLTIMCQGDVTPFLILQNVEGEKGVADFSNHQKCRKFDKIVEAFDERMTRERFLGIIESKQYEQLPD